MDGAGEEMGVQLKMHGVDTSIANVGQIYDFLLAGPDNFAGGHFRPSLPYGRPVKLSLGSTQRV
jgi:hypothetical protein